MTATCLVVMGVSGAGKSTVAAELADRLGWPMAEADEFHPAANVEKMTAGIPLTDSDRTPWLSALRDWISDRADDGRDVVVACSALKRSYRDILREASARVRFVHLRGEPDLIGERLAGRSGHFMPPALLDSQFGDLEDLAGDEDGVTVDLGRPPEWIAETALSRLGLAPDGARPG
ncbi:gluconokinase [Saccharomonospora saliphila]|uniref:gluconokinase n=1 Tax=Saccharomonospora saliphila TaxID=369829 RepID=UPI000491F871|nr:gluconokinase [Saccharomonospora saliphila]